MRGERIESAARGPVALAVTGAAVQGESGAVSLQVGGEVTPDAVFLMRDSQGLRVIDTQFQWPAEGYGDGLIDLIALGVGESPGAVLRTLRFRPSIEVGLTTEQPSAVSVERLLTARCHNTPGVAHAEATRRGSRSVVGDPGAVRGGGAAGGVAEAQFRARAGGTGGMCRCGWWPRAGRREISGRDLGAVRPTGGLDPNLARAEGVRSPWTAATTATVRRR